MRLRLGVWLIRPYLTELRRINSLCAEVRSDPLEQRFWQGTIATIDRILNTNARKARA